MSDALRTLPRPADPAMATRGLDRWHELAAQHPDPAVRDFAASYAATAHGRAVLEAVFGNSPYLTDTLVRDLAFARRLLTAPTAGSLSARFAEVLEAARQDLAAESDTARLMAGLRRMKRQAALIVALADILDLWPLESVTGALSDVAETALRLASAHLLRRAAAAGTIDLPEPERPEVGSGLIILGMGKFGARELNYSSDIDLIILYDDHLVRMAQPENMARTFVRLARDLVRIMDERTRDGYVFRTDLRLRPDPGATPLAVSVSAAETYYGSLGQNWERAAMIKARPVAGDLAAGRAFLDTLRPWIWRRNLDFAAIQDIHSIKRQINAHRGYKATAVNGHNIKLGHGGIREIEFFAQTQQLIFGGRDPRLRVADTVSALRALAEAGHVPLTTAEELIADYRFLRRVEHRLQMIDDQQTHEIPRSDAGVAALAAFLGYGRSGDFRRDLLACLTRVADHYAALFAEAPPLSGPGNLVFTGADDDPETLATLHRMGFGNPGAVAASVRAWHHGRYRATRSQRARELLTELVPALLGALAQTANPDEAFRKFDEFLARLPAGAQLFAMFYNNPNLLNLVVEIMGTAPRLADVLSRQPSRLDAVLTPGFFEPLPDRAELAADLDRVMATARDFEDALNLLRRWTNDQKLRAGIHILRHITDGDRCGPFLSDVADLALAALVPRVTEDFARRHGRFDGPGLAILALGKLGAREMTLRSDLDLIVVYQTPAEQPYSDGAKPLSPAEYYTKLTQRLINAITAPTGEGKLYDVDMRLRPSGNAGPVAVSLQAFARYQEESAWTWEHMALTRARVIAGAPELTQPLEAVRHAVLTRPRDPDRLLRDVAEMRARIEREFGTNDPWDVKYRRGGDIDIAFIAQYLMLRHGHDHPEVLAADTTEALGRLAAAGVLDRMAADDLIATVRLWRRLQGFLRLTTEGRFRADTAPPALRAALARAAFPGAGTVDFAEVETKIAEAAARAYGHYRRLIETPAADLPAAVDQETRPS